MFLEPIGVNALYMNVMVNVAPQYGEMKLIELDGLTRVHEYVGKVWTRRHIAYLSKLGHARTPIRK